MPDDYYALLGVDPDASEEAILRAYREQVAEHHPDVSDADDAGETVRRLNRAKDVLTDEARRREYDSLGHDRFRERAGDDDRDPTSPTARPEGEAGSRSRPDQRRNRASARGTSGWDPWGARGGSTDVGAFFGPRGHLDLRSILHSTASHAAGREDPGMDQPAADEAVECPRCHGRGRFVHEIDTGLGRRRRIEPCERCGGDGTLDR